MARQAKLLKPPAKKEVGVIVEDCFEDFSNWVNDPTRNNFIGAVTPTSISGYCSGNVARQTTDFPKSDWLASVAYYPDEEFLYGKIEAYICVDYGIETPENRDHPYKDISVSLIARRTDEQAIGTEFFIDVFLNEGIYTVTAQFVNFYKPLYQMDHMVDLAPIYVEKPLGQYTYIMAEITKQDNYTYHRAKVDDQETEVLGYEEDYVKGCWGFGFYGIDFIDGTDWFASVLGYIKITKYG